MTVAEIQGSVAMYLQRSVAKFNVEGTGVNLILTAMNNARKYAERRHNWSVSRKKGYFSVTTANKVAWDSPTWFDAGEEKMKEGKHWWLRGDATDTTNEYNAQDRPIKVITQGVKHVVETQNEYVPYADGSLGWRDQRYLNEDCFYSPLLKQDHGVFRGKWFELYPRPTESKLVVVDGFYWWPNWGSASKATITIKTQTAGTGPNFFSWDTLQDADLMFLRVLQTGIGSSDVQLEFDSDSITVPGNVVISLPTTLEAVVVAINNAYNAQIASTDGNSLTLSTELAEVGAVVYANHYQTASGRFVVSMEGVGSDSGSTSDWWTENASEYLILQGLVEANRLGQVFAGNKEGNLPPPVKEAERALQVLIEQDLAGEQAGGQIELY